MTRYLVERCSWGECKSLLQRAEDVSRKGLQIATGTPGEHGVLSTSSDPAAPTSGTTLVQGIATEQFTKLISDVTNTLGRVNMQLGSFEQSLRYFHDAIKARSSVGELDNELIYMKRNVASAYLCLNKAEEAMVVLEESRALADQQFTTDGNLTVYRNNQANNLGLLSSAFLLLGQYDKAWDAAAKSTELIMSTLGAESILAAEYAPSPAYRRAVPGKLICGCTAAMLRLARSASVKVNWTRQKPCSRKLSISEHLPLDMAKRQLWPCTRMQRS